MIDCFKLQEEFFMKWFIFLFMLIIGITPFSLNAQEHTHEMASVNTEQKSVTANGMVKSITQDRMSLRIFHDPIPALKWPAMNMAFEVMDHDLTHSISVGDRVNFEFIQKAGKNIIIKISK